MGLGSAEDVKDPWGLFPVVQVDGSVFLINLGGNVGLKQPSLSFSEMEL